MSGKRHGPKLPTFGQMLRAFRKERYLNQTEVGSWIGLHQTAITRIETDLQQLTPYEVAVLFERLGIPKACLNSRLWRGKPQSRKR